MLLSLVEIKTVWIVYINSYVLVNCFNKFLENLGQKYSIKNVYQNKNMYKYIKT